MNPSVKRFNKINDYKPTNKCILYLTDDRAAADFLREKNEAVCIIIDDEEKLASFDGYRYFITDGETDNDYLEKVYCHIKNIPYIIGQNDSIIVREECPDDLKKIYEMYEDDACQRFLEALPSFESIDPESRFESVKSRYMLFGYGMWIVEKKENNEVIGRVGFEPVDENTVSLGFMITESERGRGYAKAAARICIDYLHRTLPDIKIVAKSHEDNIISRHILDTLRIEYKHI